MNKLYQINQIINPDSNEMLSQLPKSDLLELLILINQYYPELRDNLGLAEDLTFGLELEFEHSKRAIIEELIIPTYKGWTVKGDCTLDEGTEITSPILKDRKEAWQDLNNICQIVQNYGSIDENSGGHIHIGAHIFDNDYQKWLNFITMWATYENIIFRFSYGKYLNGRKDLNKFARAIAEKYYCFLTNEEELQNKTPEQLKNKVNYGKYSAVNLNKVASFTKVVTNSTIEFRSPNGSLDAIIWQNNVNLFAKLLMYCKSDQYNDEIVQRRLQKVKDNYQEIELYNEIYLEQAIELCDLIFTSNRDKIDFLEQYLKEFQISYEPFSKTRTFYK